MNLKSKGILLSYRKFQENKVLLKCFTEDFGIITGIAKFSTSKKSPSFFIPGNICVVSWYARLEDQLGTLVIEQEKHITAMLHESRDRLSILESILTLISTFIIDREQHSALFLAAHKILSSLPLDDNGYAGVIKEYSLFELELLKEIGFGLDFSKCGASGVVDNLIYVSPKSGCAISEEIGKPYHAKLLNLPSFFLSEDANYSKFDLLDAMKITGTFLYKAANVIGKEKNLSVRNSLLTHSYFQ